MFEFIKSLARIYEQIADYFRRSSYANRRTREIERVMRQKDRLAKRRHREDKKRSVLKANFGNTIRVRE